MSHGTISIDCHCIQLLNDTHYALLGGRSGLLSSLSVLSLRMAFNVKVRDYMIALVDLRLQLAGLFLLLSTDAGLLCSVLPLHLSLTSDLLLGLLWCLLLLFA